MMMVAIYFFFSAVMQREIVLHVTLFMLLLQQRYASRSELFRKPEAVWLRKCVFMSCKKIYLRELIMMIKSKSDF